MPHRLLGISAWRFSVHAVSWAAAFFCVFGAVSVTRADQGVAATPTPAPTPSTSVPDNNDVAPDFNAPLNPTMWFSLEDEFSPSYDGLSGSSNQVNVRGQLPLGHVGEKLPTLFLPNDLQLVKFKVPIVTGAPAGAQKGAGDTTLGFLEFQGSKAKKWAFGPLFKIPTAGTADLGSGKWSVGPAVGYTYTHGTTVIGWYQQTYFSFAGPKSRPPVSQTQFQPALSFILKKGWILGFSQMQFTYNWENNQWSAVPLGFRIARNYRDSRGQLAAGFEAEKNLVAVQGTPGWTLRLNFKYRFSSR